MEQPQTAQTSGQAPEQERREEKARKARELADQLYPGERWIEVEMGIYLSPERPIGSKSNYLDEKRDAEILRDKGSTVYLVSEPHTGGKKFDAIVDGDTMEFKNIYGGLTSVQNRFMESREQAHNVFMNLERTALREGEVLRTLSGARNSPKYPENGDIQGGKVILKFAGQEHLLCLDIDGLKRKQA
jgi:hypothetical protein